ncbi:MAG: ribonuclease E activity regulator RraA [Acidimicrobiia bacterium]|nr:ribonuclease E activity regulator RraA [Acidimicrobiia bacterium]
MTSFATADLCDEHDADTRVLEPGLRHYGGRTSFCGSVHTLKLFEDNSLVREALDAEGDGRVLVIDAGGSRRCAVVGGNLAELAAANGWSGIVVWGCVRDVHELSRADTGILALASHPRRSVKRGEGQSGLVISIGGIDVRPGDWVYADDDGVIVAPHDLR